MSFLDDIFFAPRVSPPSRCPAGSATSPAARKAAEAQRACILLWMNGGPARGYLGPSPHATAAHQGHCHERHRHPDQRASPKLAERSDKLAIMRGMARRKPPRARSYLLRTGRVPGGPFAPGIGCSSQGIDRPDASCLRGEHRTVPFLSPRRTPGFLGRASTARRRRERPRQHQPPEPGRGPATQGAGLDLPQGVFRCPRHRPRRLPRRTRFRFPRRSPGLSGEATHRISPANTLMQSSR